MSDAAQAGSVQPLPFEGLADTSEESAADAILNLMGSDEDNPEEQEGETPSQEDEEGELEADEPEEGEEAEESEEEEDEGEAEEEPADEPKYRVKVDGTEVEVTLSELQAGYSRTQDYTKKTQQVAAERRAVQELQTVAQQTRAEYGQRLAALESTLQAIAPAEPDWANLRQQDPAEFAAQWAEHQHRQQEMVAVQQERQRIEGEIAVEQQRALQETLAAERQRLVQAIPEWSDPAKATAEKAALAKYAQETFGYTAEDLAQVYDHRIMVILKKAAAYDAVVTKGKDRITAKQEAPKVLKPGNRPAAPAAAPQKKAAREAFNRVAKTGRVEDAARAIMNLNID